MTHITAMTKVRDANKNTFGTTITDVWKRTETKFKI